MSLPARSMADSILGREEFPQYPEKALYISTTNESRRQHRTHDRYSDPEKEMAYYAAPPSPVPLSPRAMEKSAVPKSKPSSPTGTERASHDERASHRGSGQPRSKSGSQVIGSVYHVAGGAGPCASTASPSHRSVAQIAMADDDAEELANARLAGKAVHLVLSFLFPIPLLSLILAIWTVFITLAIAMTFPLRLIFTRRRSFSEVVLSFLTPALNLHLRSARCAPVSLEDLRLGKTFAVLVASSPLSVALALWSGVLAVYWMFAAMIGNPDGLDGRSDGRELVLVTRRHWVDWLLLGVHVE